MEKEKNVYNPSKKYTWKPEDEFVLNGEEFGIILNSLRSTLNTPEAAKILLASRANDVIESLITRGVENGDVKEMEGENAPSQEGSKMEIVK